MKQLIWNKSSNELCILDPLSLQCSVNILIPVEDLFTGHQVSDCLQPCLRTEATVVEGEMTRVVSTYNCSMFTLAFSDEVRVKKTSVDSFNFMDSLNFFGSNLGLWPGLGLYQILEWMLGIFIVSQILKKLRKCCFCNKK